MKLPRLQYTYAVFYVFERRYDSRVGHGRHEVRRQCCISSSRHLREIEGNITGENLKYGYINTVITNYKLLSIKIIWG